MVCSFMYHIQHPLTTKLWLAVVGVRISMWSKAIKMKFYEIQVVKGFGIINKINTVLNWYYWVDKFENKGITIIELTHQQRVLSQYVCAFWITVASFMTTIGETKIYDRYSVYVKLHAKSIFTKTWHKTMHAPHYSISQIKQFRIWFKYLKSNDILDKIK